jgi:hypothetical protein
MKKNSCSRGDLNHQPLYLGALYSTSASHSHIGCPRNEKKKNFGSNRNKPKQDLFRVCFGLFRETKKTNFWFVSVFRTCIETTETNRTVLKRTETIRNVPKNLSHIYLGSSVCHIPIIFLSYSCHIPLFLLSCHSCGTLSYSYHCLSLT